MVHGASPLHIFYGLHNKGEIPAYAVDAMLELHRNSKGYKERKTEKLREKAVDDFLGEGYMDLNDRESVELIGDILYNKPHLIPRVQATIDGAAPALPAFGGGNFAAGPSSRGGGGNMGLASAVAGGGTVTTGGDQEGIEEEESGLEGDEKRPDKGKGKAE